MKPGGSVGVTNSIATKLLKTVFSFYLIIAVGVTAAHMVIEYNYQKRSIRNDLKDFQRAFEQGLSVGLWQINQEALETVVKGMLENPAIVGVTVSNENGNFLALGGTISHQGQVKDTDLQVDISGISEVAFRDESAYQFELFQHAFPVNYTYENKVKYLGETTIYSSSAVVYRRVKLGFLMLVVNALLKTAALWLIFMIFATYLLRRPLAAFTAAARKITLENLDSFKVNVQTTGGNELKVLEDSFNAMVEGLHLAVSRREKVEADLRKSEQKYQDLYDNAPDVYFSVDMATSQIRDCNQAMVTTTGFDKDELIGRSIFEMYAPESADYARNHLFPGFLEHGNIESEELKVKRKDGSVFDVSLNASAIRDPDDHILYSRSMWRNITDQKRSEERLKHQRELFESIYYNIPVMITIYDPDFKKIHVNKHYVDTIGWTNSEIETIDLFEQCYPDPEYREQAVKYMQAATSDWREFQVKSKQGELIDSVWSNIKLTDNTQIGIGLDIRDRKKWENQIRNSLKEKEILLQEIHHRVKNNMQIISSLLKLQIGQQDNEAVDLILKENMGRVYAMAAIHESLHQSVNLAEIDLKLYIEKLTQMLLNTYTVNQAQVAFRIEVADIKLNIHKANPLGLVINELISNSLKYAFPGTRKGTIRVISTIRDDQELVLTVSDDGVGIPSDFNWNSADTLGIRLIKNICEKQLSGSIDLNRENGTAFTIRFHLEAGHK